MDRKEFERLFVAEEKAVAAEQEHFNEIRTATLESDGSLNWTGSRALDYEWVEEHKPLEATADAAKKALLDFLRASIRG